jgi:hypothetical protein
MGRGERILERIRGRESAWEKIREMGEGINMNRW